MYTLLKFLFVAILVLWLLRMVVRLALPYLVRKASEKMMGQARDEFQQQYGGQTRQARHEERRSPDGKITIDYVPPKNQRFKDGPKKAGEFVDYEEIK